jgi:hypothetical protein
MPIIGTLAGASARGFGGMRTFAPAGLVSDILVVAGGGSGSYGSYAGAGGGAGGYLEFAGEALTFDTNYVITVGAGGAIPAVIAAGNDGTLSKFGSLTTVVGGGGGGGGTITAANNGRNGGSGGGGATNDTSGGGITFGGSPTTGQGFAGGGNGNFTSPPYPSGGGGGAGGAGATAPNSTSSGNGGVGKFTTLSNAMGAATSSGQLSGGNYYFAGGGGGANHLTGTSGTGGLGGGGNGGQYNSSAGVSGTVNTGGGGGSGTNNTVPGAGGSGIIIARYQSATQKSVGGTIVSSGGYYYHTFLQSGNFYTQTTNPITGFSLWLDGSDSSTITQSGGLISQWNDKSSNAYTFTATGSQRPTFTSNGLNNKSVVSFDGSSQYLVGTNTTGLNPTSWSLFIVAYATGSATQCVIAKRGNSNPADDAWGAAYISSKSYTRGRNLSGGSNNSLLNASGGLFVLGSSGNNGPVGSAQLTSSVMTDNSNQGYYFNQINPATATAGSQSVAGAGQVTVGTLLQTTYLELLNGYIAEIILYSSALSNSDRQAVEGYLKAKWGI